MADDGNARKNVVDVLTNEAETKAKRALRVALCFVCECRRGKTNMSAVRRRDHRVLRSKCHCSATNCDRPDQCLVSDRPSQPYFWQDRPECK